MFRFLTQESGPGFNDSEIAITICKALALSAVKASATHVIHCRSEGYDHDSILLSVFEANNTKTATIKLKRKYNPETNNTEQNCLPESCLNSSSHNFRPDGSFFFVCWYAWASSYTQNKISTTTNKKSKVHWWSLLHTTLLKLKCLIFCIY